MAVKHVQASIKLGRKIAVDVDLSTYVDEKSLTGLIMIT